MSEPTLIPLFPILVHRCFPQPSHTNAFFLSLSFFNESSFTRTPVLRRAPSRIELKLEDKAEYEEYRKRRKAEVKRKRKQRARSDAAGGAVDTSVDESMDISVDDSLDDSSLTPPGPSAAARSRAQRIGLE